MIGLYVDEGNIFNLVARDTLLNGKFSFRDTVSVTKKMLIRSDNKGFPGDVYKRQALHLFRKCG